MMGSIEESDDDEYSGEGGWISWFCGLKGHEIFCEVDEEYVRDNFNLYGLRSKFQFYDHSLEMILSYDVPDEDDLNDPDFLEIYSEATDLYGIIHSRFIISPRGLQLMRDKYVKGEFGYCPRALCDRHHVLPIGLSEDCGQQANVFCPKCEQVYSPKAKWKELDGIYFGTSFPQVFLQTYPTLLPLEPPVPFVPRVFGFRLHKAHSLITRKLIQNGELPADGRPTRDEEPVDAEKAEVTEQAKTTL